MAHHVITVDKMFLRRKCSGAFDSQPGDGAVKGDPPATGGGSTASSEGGRLRDLVSAVKRIGNDHYTRHINWQKRQLCDLLSAANGLIINISTVILDRLFCLDECCGPHVTSRQEGLLYIRPI